MIKDLLVNHAWFVYILIALLSISVGSLLNAVIYRLPLMMQAEWKHQCCDLLNIKEKPQQQSLNLFFPRSFCPKCKTTIKAWQNIPLLSYLYLQGRCNQCKESISIRYPLIELMTLLLSLYSCWHFGLTAQLPFALLAIWILIAIFFIDLDHQLVPDSLSLGLLWLGLIANTHHLFASLPNAVLSAVVAYLSLWVFIQVFYLVTGKIGMGNGDFKLFAAFGAWFGWTLLPLILLFASITGSIVGITNIVINKQSRESTIAFGPYLCVAGLVALFWGHALIDWYLTFSFH